MHLSSASSKVAASQRTAPGWIPVQPSQQRSRARVFRPPRVAELSQTDALDEHWTSYLSFEGESIPRELWPALKTEVPRSYPPADHPLLEELERLEGLVQELQRAGSDAQRKLDVVMATSKVAGFFVDPRNALVASILRSLGTQQQHVLAAVIAAGQEHVLTLPEAQPDQSTIDPSQVKSQLVSLANYLLRIEHFYDSIGGIVGYQAKSVSLIVAGTAELRDAQRARQHQGSNNSQHGSNLVHAPSAPSESLTWQEPGASHSLQEGEVAELRYHVPRALDLAGEGGREVGQRVAAAGLAALPRMAEIYPVGGAGDRLGLQCETTGQCLPAAMLPYCGRTMMEGLMRDLQAREALYYKLTGKQVTTPVAIMTSDAKGNHSRITGLMESLQWFGRGRDSFRLFRQPLVPVLRVGDGRWLLTGLLQPMGKPGGHGVIWKLMRDEGVFEWMKSQSRDAAIVRQISNPMAGVDTTLLALGGYGMQRGNSAFGFMSCDRTIGAAEGCNVLQERKVWKDGKWQYEYGYTNIEYTEFDRLGISDQPVDGNSRRSVFPANTNVLYVGLPQAEEVVNNAVATGSSEQLMPGLIFNLKKKIAYKDPLTGSEDKVQAGRMECTMQNIADFMTDRLDRPLLPGEAAGSDLSTFLVYNMRRKVTSSAKKRREPGSTRISQTPDGSFYDLQRNAWHLLQQCGVKQVPELGSVEQYLSNGPGFIFLFNPALGPLWSVISQKLQGGSLQQGSELVLEVAEARLQDVDIEGSLLVHAENVVGHMETSTSASGSSDQQQQQQQQEPRLVFSSRVGRVHMSNVVIQNAGIDWTSPSNVYWKHSVARREAVRVVLRGHSEFEAHNVIIRGTHTLEVPDGHRMVVTQGATQDEVVTTLYPLLGENPTWRWVYTMQEDGHIALRFSADPSATTSAAPPVYTQQPVQVTGPATPVPQPGRQAASHGVPEHLRSQGVQPVHEHWQLLQQLTEAGVVLDFTI